MALQKLLSERFWQKVDIRGDEECWPWKGALNSDGYGALGQGGRGASVIGAHRVAWFLEHREWPDEHVLHRCDNPACVRISHLFLGSHADNMSDRAAKGRIADTAGESNPAAKLTEAEVQEIRRLHSLGRTQRSLAKQFNVGKATIWRVVHRTHWTNI